MTIPAIKDKTLVQSSTLTQALATKEPTLNPGVSTDFYRGDKSWQNFANTARAVPLTGLSTATNSVALSTDSILTGVGKLQAQVSSKEPALPAGTASQYYRGDKTWQTLDKTAVGLANVDNTSDANKPISTAVSTALGNKVNTSIVGAVNGIAQLDAAGKVPSTQLPSYVDDVLEYANLATFPVTGETGKIYITLDTNKSYRWSGSAYAEISASPGSTDSVAEGTTNKYFTEARVRATILTGLSTVTNAAIAATDSVLGAFGKLQKQVTDLIATVSGKEPALAAGTTAQYYRGDKTWQTHDKASVGLANVDNTSDANKPVSTAQANADANVLSAAANASNLTSGTVAVARLPALTGGDVTSSAGSGSLTLANVATAGTATKITYNAKGLVTSGTTLSVSDLPAHDHARLVNGSAIATLDSSGNFVAPGNISAYSDESLKTNWRSLDANFLEQVAKVKYGIYDRIDTGEEQAGVSANSLKEVLSQVVSKAILDDKEIQTVAYGQAALVIVLELTNKVLDMQKEIDALKLLLNKE